jgi:membrane protease YdiL (CAAX protease family)
MSQPDQNRGPAVQGFSTVSTDLLANARSPRRLFIWLWCAGLPGVAAVLYFVLPSLLGGSPAPAPLWVLSLVAGLQMCVMLTIAVWAGVALAPKLGLRAPVLQAFASSQAWRPALRPQLVPGVLGGLLGVVLLLAVSRFTPPSMLALQGKVPPFHIAVRVLYGGVTEELIVRWGLMSGVLWVFWRFLQRSDTPPRTIFVAVAIAVSAISFGALHLPAASALLGALTTDVVAYVILGNAAFGILAGCLFWRFGLECAIIAHSVAHLVLATLGY